MLRITVSKGGKSAVNYFKGALSKQDYYSEKAEVLGKWHGKTAAQLGFSGVVNEQDFEQVVNNRNPLTGDKITVRDAANRRAGFDFTFNAPKSVSVVEAITKDETIRKAHRTALERAMRSVEADMQTQEGQGKDKRYESTGNIIYASFEHDTSRPIEHQREDQIEFIPDPHLHTHCFVMNVTWNERKNRYQAIEAGNIKKNGSYYEALYHCHLAEELQKAGYQTRRTKNSFEIKGISRETIEKFSNRTKEIEKVAQEKNLTWAKDKADLGAKTRNNKSKSVSENQIQQNWSERLSLEERFNISNLKGVKEAASGLAVEKKTGEVSPVHSVDLALQHFMECKSAVTEKQVLGYAMKLGIGQISPAQIKAELDRRKGDEVFTGEKRSDVYLTTKKAYVAERQMKNFAVSTRAKYQGLNPDYTPQQDFLNDGQKHAIYHALNSPDQVILISGGAGTGKTTLMKEVKAGVEQNKKRLYAFAPSAEASRGVLRSKGFKDADTIKKLLTDYKVQEQLKDQVILIDEAGMIGNQTMNSVFNLAKKQNARVILSGDWKQHNSVESGDALRLLEQHAQMPVARVSEVVRQKDSSDYKEAVLALADGNYEHGFDKLEKMNSIIEIEDQEERHNQIADDYLKSVQAPLIHSSKGNTRQRTAIVVAPTHAEGKAITQSIRAKLKEVGIVDQKDKRFQVLRNLSYTEAEKQDHLNYLPGMTIQFHKSCERFKAGNCYDVINSSDDGLVLIQDQKTKQSSPLPFEEVHKFQVCQKETIGIAEGDIIRITRNGQAINNTSLNNGDTYTIKGFTKEGNIQTTNGKVIHKDYQNMSLGYYRTSHSAQGRDADDVLIAQSSLSFSASNEKQFYVSVSRGVERCFIYTDDKRGLKQAISQDANRMSASEVLEAHQAYAESYPLQFLRVNHYQHDMENYRHERLKETAYEPDIAILSARSRKEISIDI